MIVDYVRRALEGVRPPKGFKNSPVPSEEANLVRFYPDCTEVHNTHGIKGLNVVIPSATTHGNNIVTLQEALLAYERGDDLVLWKLSKK
ncbi:hypothetical protein [Mesorhizobium sp. KR1-2]|uniref:hypothetical protein n=1 Tax=Mesorhizobium sp. KR1-2 TaxID=3156609 RepID=UPI0032B465DF